MLPALRVVAVLHALSFLLQPVMAGLFLSGQDTAIDTHATNGMILVTLCLVMTIIAYPVWRRGQVPRQAFTTALALLVVELIQLTIGFSHIMWLHIPLGVIMMGGIAQFMPLVMKPQAGTAGTAATPVAPAVAPAPAAPAAEAGE